jgi:hypothetical protein
MDALMLTVALTLLFSFVMTCISFVQFWFFALKSFLSVNSAAIAKKQFSLKANLNMAINPLYVFSSSFLKHGGLSHVEAATLYLKRTLIYLAIFGICLYFMELNK